MSYAMGDCIFVLGDVLNARYKPGGDSTRRAGTVTLMSTCTVDWTAANSAVPSQPPFPISGLSA